MLMLLVLNRCVRHGPGPYVKDYVHIIILLSRSMITMIQQAQLLEGS